MLPFSSGNFYLIHNWYFFYNFVKKWGIFWHKYHCVMDLVKNALLFWTKVFVNVYYIKNTNLQNLFLKGSFVKWSSLFATIDNKWLIMIVCSSWEVYFLQKNYVLTQTSRKWMNVYSIFILDIIKHSFDGTVDFIKFKKKTIQTKHCNAKQPFKFLNYSLLVWNCYISTTGLNLLKLVHSMTSWNFKGSCNLEI